MKLRGVLILFALVLLLAGCLIPPERRIWLSTSKEEAEETRSYPQGAIRIATWLDFKPAACSLTFDDGTLDQYSLAFPELDRRGLAATFFVITGFMERGYWDDAGRRRLLFCWDQARQIAWAGHEIGSHGETHLDLTRRKDVLDEELADSYKKIRREIPEQRGLSLCWAYWRSDTEAEREARKYYLAARSGGGLSERYLEVNGGIPPASPPNLYRINALGALTGESNVSWRRICDRVFDQGGWFVANFHGLDDGRIEREALGWEALPLERFRLVLDYLQEKGFWIAPFGKVARYIQERDEARLRRIELGPRSLSFILSDGLNDRIYDQELSLEVRLPPGWEQVIVLQKGKVLDFRTTGSGLLRLNARPNKKWIVIEKLD